MCPPSDPTANPPTRWRWSSACRVLEHIFDQFEIQLLVLDHQHAGNDQADRPMLKMGSTCIRRSAPSSSSRPTGLTR
jgi:hypothetical protein